MSGSRTRIPILLGTGNRTKQEVLRQLLVDSPVSPITPQELSLQESPPEEGETHRAIAQRKAEHWSRAASIMTIASDPAYDIKAVNKLGDLYPAHLERNEDASADQQYNKPR